jgi:hypothetical protein
MPDYPTQAIFDKYASTFISQYFDEIQVINSNNKVTNVTGLPMWEEGIGNDKNIPVFIAYEFSGPTFLRIFPDISRVDKIVAGYSVLSPRAQRVSNQIEVVEFIEPSNEVIEFAEQSDEVIEDDSKNWIDNEGVDSKSIEISKGNEEIEEADLISVACKNKKLNVTVWSPDALISKGKGKAFYSFDDGKPIKFAYYRSKNSPLINLANPKLFTTKLINSQDKFSFQIQIKGGNSSFEHEKGNFGDYASIFIEKGCKL